MQDLATLQRTHAIEILSAHRLRAAEAARESDPAAAGRRFEALLATQLVKEMRRSLHDGFFGGGPGADVYEGWLDEHLGDALVRGRGLGLAAAVAASLGARPVPTEARP